MTAAATDTNDSLPPRVPETREALERAIILLGHRVQAPRLKKQARRELENLVGVNPGREEALRWKGLLKSLRDEF